jgi:hypothetical protein
MDACPWANTPAQSNLRYWVRHSRTKQFEKRAVPYHGAS